MHGDARATGRRSRRARRPRTSRRAGRASKRSRARCWTIPSCARARGCASRRRRCAAPASSAGWAPGRRRRTTSAPDDAQTVRPDDPFDEVHEAELVEPLPAILAAARALDALDRRARRRGRPHGDDDAGRRRRAAADAARRRPAAQRSGAADRRRPGRRASARAAGRARRGGRGARARTGARRARGRRSRARRGGRWPRCRAAATTRASTPCWSTARASRPRWSAPPSSAPPALAPLLVRLQDALAPPAAERFAQPALADALDAATELYGGGAFDVAALGAGDYGVELHGGRRRDARRAPARRDGADAACSTRSPRPRAAAPRRGDARRARRSRQALRDVPGPRLPCSAELFLAPVPRRPRKPPGTGWLLGLHAPAGASLGRFGHALGADALGAIAELEAAERRARPHGDLRRRRLRADAGADRSRGAPADVAPDARALALERSRPKPTPTTSWRPPRSSWSPIPTRRTRSRCANARPATPIVPASFARLRSRTAPAGIARLLVGWSLWRQHASWALPLGPLAELAFIPRLCLDGFVIAPASWRLPPGVRTPADDPALAAGRRGPAPRAGRRRRRAAARRPDGARARPPISPITIACSRSGRRSTTSSIATAAAWKPWSCWSRSPMRATPPEHARRIGRDSIGGRGATAGAARPGFEGWRTFKLFGAPGTAGRSARRCCCRPIRAGQHAGEIDRLVLPALHRRTGQPAPPARPRARAGRRRAATRSSAGCATAFAGRARRRRS